MKDMENTTKVTVGHTPQVTNADADGTSCDLQLYDWCLILFDVGDSADTLSGSNYIECEIEESADDSTFTDVADSDLVSYVAGTNDGTAALINDPAEDQTVVVACYIGSKRYVRGVLNFTGTHSTGTPIGIVNIRGNYKYPPTS